MASIALVIYLLADDSIVGYYQFSNPATGDLYPLNPITEGKIVLPDGHSSPHEQHKWRVLSGAMTQKDEVTVNSDKRTITTDGVDEATITLSGLVKDAEVSLGDGLSVTVLASNPVLVLTSDVPRQFQVIVSDILHWSNLVIVEAQ